MFRRLLNTRDVKSRFRVWTVFSISTTVFVCAWLIWLATGPHIPWSASPEIRKLIEKTLSGDPAERAKAARALRDFGPRAVPAIPFLVRLLGDDPDPTSANRPGWEAYQTLARIGKPAIGPLVATLREKENSYRRIVIHLLGVIGDLQNDRRAVPALITIIDDENEDPKIRVQAAFALRYMPDGRAVAPLLRQVQNRKEVNDDMLIKAAIALGKIGDRRAVEPLIAVAKRNRLSESDRKCVVDALANIGDRRTFEPLLAIWEDGTAPKLVRIASLRALGSTKDPRAFGILRDALDDSDDCVRVGAVQGLGRLGDARSVVLLKSVLRKERDTTVPLSVRVVSVRRTVIEELIGTGDIDVIDFVLAESKAMGDEGDQTLGSRMAVIGSLALSPKSSQYLHVVEAFADKNSNIRLGTAAVLATSVSYGSVVADQVTDHDRLRKVPALDDAKIVHALMKVVQDQNESKETRQYAKEALSKCDAPEVMKLLGNMKAEDG